MGIKLRIIKAAGSYKVGQVISEASETDANILCLVGVAERMPVDESSAPQVVTRSMRATRAPKKQPRDPSEPRRTYKRRDMRAEE